MRHPIALTLILSLFSFSAVAEEYTFVVENNADQRIVGIEVSEDGEEWAYFDIGRGIPSGESVTLAWDESTNGSDCEWMFRAKFSGGDVLESDWVNFCEDDVVMTFEFD